MDFYIMKNNEKFQGPYKTQAAANAGIVVCEKFFHTGLDVEGFKKEVIKRQFKKESSRRLVLSKVSKLHCYHTECAPADAQEAWCRTQQTYCAKCYQPLHSKSVLVGVI